MCASFCRWESVLQSRARSIRREKPLSPENAFLFKRCHTGHQLNFRILAAVNANQRFREFVEGATGEGRTEVADRTVHG